MSILACVKMSLFALTRGYVCLGIELPRSRNLFRTFNILGYWPLAFEFWWEI